MDYLFLVFLSLSLSGSILGIISFLLSKVMITRINKTCCYYIWIIVLVRLMLPFHPTGGIVGLLFERIENSTNKIVTVQEHIADTQQNDIVSPSVTADIFDPVNSIEESEVLSDSSPFRFLERGIIYLCILWIVAALAILLRKLTIYQDFLRFIKAGRKEVDSPELLNLFGEVCKELNIRRRVELYTNNILASPMQVGFIKAYVILPDTNLDKSELKGIFLHELVHYKRMDFIYKWVAAVILCIHWFNPIVHRIVKEINKNCELSCDEFVLKQLSAEERRKYGNTLLACVNTNRTYKEPIAAITLYENVKLLEERLCAIMNYKRTTKKTLVYGFILTLLLLLGSAVTGVYNASAKEISSSEKSSAGKTEKVHMDTLKIGITKYYLVDTEKQLRAIGVEYPLSGNYMLNQDIVLTKEWVPIGNKKRPFTGIFEGNGFRISNLKITDTNVQYAGFFGYVKNGVVHNVELYNVNIEVGKGNKTIDPIAAHAQNSTIEDCRVIETKESEKDSSNTISQTQIDEVSLKLLKSSGNWAYVGIFWSYVSEEGKKVLMQEAKNMGNTINKTAQESWLKQFISTKPLTKKIVDAGVIQIINNTGTWGQGLNCILPFMTEDGIDTVRDIYADRHNGYYPDALAGNKENEDIYESQKEMGNTSEYDKKGINIMQYSGTWGESLRVILPYMSASAVAEVVDIYIDKHVFLQFKGTDLGISMVETVEKTIKEAYPYMTKDAVKKAKSKLDKYR